MDGAAASEDLCKQRLAFSCIQCTGKAKSPKAPVQSNTQDGVEDTVNEGVTEASKLERADGAVGNGIIPGHK